MDMTTDLNIKLKPKCLIHNLKEQIFLTQH